MMTNELKTVLRMFRFSFDSSWEEGASGCPYGGLFVEVAPLCGTPILDREYCAHTSNATVALCRSPPPGLCHVAVASMQEIHGLPRCSLFTELAPCMLEAGMQSSSHAVAERTPIGTVKACRKHPVRESQ